MGRHARSISHAVDDCLWSDQRLIVELDGGEAHNPREAIERDKRPDRRLAADGWLVIRVSWRQLHVEPDALERDLRRALAARSGLGAAQPPP